MAFFNIDEDHSDECVAAAGEAIRRALDTIGGKAEGYAVLLAAQAKGPKGNTLDSGLISQIRNSITHRVDGNVVSVGSNLDIAAFVELGTAKEYNPSADWIETTVKKGPHSGLDKWYWWDEDAQTVRLGLPMTPTPFLRPAVENHKEEYEEILRRELEKG